MPLCPRRALISLFMTAALSSQAAENFSACPQFFANAKPPAITPGATDRAAIADTGEKRTNRFFPDARLRAAERATLADYKDSGFDRGHMAPAGDMPSPQAMAQSFSLANMVPQAPRHNQGAWKTTVEAATKQYAGRASGDVYVITGPVFTPSIAESRSIGAGQVHVPTYLFKLVYDQDKNTAWAYWHANNDATRGSRPISYAELVQRTGIHFLPGVYPNER